MWMIIKIIRAIFSDLPCCASPKSTLCTFPSLFYPWWTFFIISISGRLLALQMMKKSFSNYFFLWGSPGQHLITLVTSGWEWVMCGCQVCSSRPTDKASSPAIATLPLPTCSAFGSAAQNFTHFAHFCVWPLSKSPISIFHSLFFSPSLLPWHNIPPSPNIFLLSRSFSPSKTYYLPWQPHFVNNLKIRISIAKGTTDPTPPEVNQIQFCSFSFPNLCWEWWTIRQKICNYITLTTCFDDWRPVHVVVLKWMVNFATYNRLYIFARKWKWVQIFTTK